MLRRRNLKGQELAEFGPTLFIIFIVVLFPALNLLYFLAAYSAGWYVNHMIVRELSVTSVSNWSTVVTNKINQWDNSSLSSFTGKLPTSGYSVNVGPPASLSSSGSVVTATVVPSSNPNSPPLIRTVTTLNIPSFLNIPYFNNVPGLGKPVPMTF